MRRLSSTTHPAFTLESPSQQALDGTSAWSGARLRACIAEPDLVAVYESRDGSLALLLRHTIAPLAQERRLWREATRRAARAIIQRLRSANLDRTFVIVQWLPFDEVARVLQRWTCRYDGDAERRSEIARVVEGYLIDRAFVTSSPNDQRPTERAEPRSARRGASSE